MTELLFPTGLPGCEWVEFTAKGFTEPVCGVVYRRGDTVTNGMALGGIDTGCIDLETSGLLGYCTIFNSHVPRRGPINLPILGMSVGDKTWVMCDPKQTKQPAGVYQVKEGAEPLPPLWPENTQLEFPTEIHYWGHYPVADVEFETTAPVSVGLRAWNPFLPGDVTDSMIPGIVFEVQLRNTSGVAQSGTAAFSFPGPTADEALTDSFVRKDLRGGFAGTEITTELASYALGAIGEKNVRTGGELGADAAAWACISGTLPNPEGPGASAAVDFALRAGESRVVRFALTWCAPTWNAWGHNNADKDHPNDKPRTFTHMYAKSYPNPAETADLLAEKHESLLGRVLAWQQEVYTDKKLPVWLRDSLVNVLYMITEDGYWAQKKDPLPDWVRDEDGLFGMNECPRDCPQIECIPCSFYGSLPITYFFPKLELSTIRGYQGYQYEDGAPPWIFGGMSGGSPFIDIANPSKGYQWATNGISLAAIVSSFVMCHDTPDHRHANELYPMVKRTMDWTVKLRRTPSYSLGERIISIPDRDSGEPMPPPREWFEATEPGWFGMTAHVAGLHIAQLRITERMAELAGDEEYAGQCREWITVAQEAMEDRLWDERGYYLNFFEPDTGLKSDFIFGYQLDGEWITSHHGIEGTVPKEKALTVLDTIKKSNIAITRFGATNYANPDGTPIRQAKTDAGFFDDYGAYSYFPPEALMLAMTYMYKGQTEFGLELARNVWHDLICLQGYTWDMPNVMRGDADTGERTVGSDYYQDMMLWSLPSALNGEDLSSVCREGGLVERVIQAAGKNRK